MAIVLEKFFSALTGTLFTLVKDEIVFVLGVQDEIERLQRRLERVLPILADADLRRLQDTAIEAWVTQLKDVAYDADDIIDECRIEAEKSRRKKPSASSSSSLPVSCLSSPLHFFRHCGVHRCHQIGNKINKLNQKLDDIIKDLPLLSLRSTPIYRNVESGISHKTSPLVEPDLVGERIKEDTRMLADMLLSQEYKIQHKVCVFAIIGMGGIGKTTLAQKIYNDEKLRAEFNHIPPIWVCISQNFSEIDLLRAIITRAGGNPRESRDKEDLEPMLHEVVKDKRFLLILDDVWDGKVWENLLQKPLLSASMGSRVLVTTRHESVAMQMRTVYRHQVERLSDDDGWLLLCKMVFVDGVDGVDMVKSLRDIGMRIVRKCDGLPLAVKVIAGVLRNKSKSLLDWEGVLRNPAWTLTELPDGVMGALYLSYLELPSHLKQCFLYFAFFPEDEEHFIMDIVSLWTAEGFVEGKGDNLMEEVAEEYWEELISRSLLQPNDTHFKSMVCKMHDLLHTLAQHIASDECFNWDLQEFRDNSISTSSLCIKSRRIFSGKGDETIRDIIREHMTLRTFSIQFLSSFPEDAVVKFKCLRVLDVQYLSANSLPKCIGDLIHLRYLNLSFSEIGEIPESIGNLCNLQVFIIHGCTNLQNLPTGIAKLHSLRHFDCRDSGLSRLPIVFQSLQNLVRLLGFFVSSRKSNSEQGKRNKTSFCNLEELGSLSQLMTLFIFNLESSSGRKAAKAARLGSKLHLTMLELNCTTCSSDVDLHAHYRQEEIEKIGEVYEELCPPTCLKNLSIDGYFGLNFPSWMTETPSSVLPNLKRLFLKNCIVSRQLPPLGLLPQLECLIISGASSVTSIRFEFLGKSTYPVSSFPKLNYLCIKNMPNLEEWCYSKDEIEANQILTLHPCLHILNIGGCPKLRSLPEGLPHYASALRYLWIKDTHSLMKVENFLSVQNLVLIDNPSLEKVSNLAALKELYMEGCEKVNDVERLDALQVLVVRSSRMLSLPEWLLAEGGEKLKVGALHTLSIIGNSQLLSRCLVGRLDWHKIRLIPCFTASHCSEDLEDQIQYTRSPFSFYSKLA